MTEPSDSPDELVTLAEASRRLGLETSWLRRLVSRGALPARRMGSSWFVAPADLAAFAVTRRTRGWVGGVPRTAGTTAAPAITSPAQATDDRQGPASSRRQLPAAKVSSISSPVLIGRRSEVARLLEAATHPPAVVTVEGEAGVGKTRLVTEVLARCQVTPRHVLIGGCHPVHEPFLLGPIIDALRGAGPLLQPAGLTPVAGVLAPLVPELADRLPPEPPSPGDPLARRHLLFRAAAEVLAGVGPVVCVVEDLQWADDGTIDFLRFLARQLPPTVTLIATYRREQLAAGSAALALATRPSLGATAAAIHLDPLSRAEVGELIGAILRTDEVSADVTTALHASTGGIPFVVEEVLRLMGDGTATPRVTGRQARRTVEVLAVPAPVRAYILDRVAALRPDAQRVVEAAAVLGEAVDEAVLTAVVGLSAHRTARALSEALIAAVLVEPHPGQYGFRHTVAAQAVYDAVTTPERRRLHRRAARVLEDADPRPAAQLARHYEHAGLDREWVAAAEAAAALAETRSDDWTSAHFLADALRAPAIPIATRARLANKLARAALSAHVLQDVALGHLRAVVDEQSLPAGLRGLLHGHIGLLLIELGDATAGYREQVRAVPELLRRPATAALVMGNLALPGSVEGHESDHRRWLRKAITQAEKAANPNVTFTTTTVAALVRVLFGDDDAWDAVRAVDWDAGSPFEKRQLLWLASQLPVACTYLGQYRQSREYLDDAERRAAETIWDRFRPLREIGDLQLRWATGDWGGLEVETADLAEAVAVELPAAATLARVVMGSLQVARGQFDAAERTLSATTDAALAGGLVPAVAEAGAGLARIRLAAGDPRGALEPALRALTIVEAKGTWPWSAELVPETVEALVACGREVEADGLIRRLARGLRGRDAPLGAAALTLSQGLIAQAVGRLGSAARTLTRAALAYGALPRPYGAARASARCGEVLLAMGDAAGADHVLTALGQFDALRAIHDADRARQVLRTHAITFVPRRSRGRPSYGTDLSPQERRVAELVVAGIPTHAIAQRLFLSVRTVEHHLSAIRRKRDLPPRAPLTSDSIGEVAGDE